MCLWAANLIIQCIDNLGGNALWGILYGAAAAPIIVGAYFYIRFFMAPADKARRGGIVMACMLVILSAVGSAVIALLQFLLLKGATLGYFLGVCISSALVSIVYFYYAGVAKRFVA